MTGLWGLVIVQIWQISGYLMVVYISGLSSIPGELKESMKIDGANRWQLLRNLIIPLVMPSITISLFLSTSTAFKMFDLNYSLTKGNFDTMSIAYEIYAEAFVSNNYGSGSAKAVIFFIVVAGITILQTIYTKRKEVVA